MQLTFEREGNELVFYLAGELDEYGAPGIRRLVDGIIDDHASVQRVVFNLSEIGFMDSTGIGFLIGRYKKCKRYSIPTYIRDPNNAADKILSISGIYTLIPKL